MFNRLLRSRYLWLIGGVSFIGFVLAVNSIPKIHWRFAIVRLKASGSLTDVSWIDLFRMGARGNRFNLSELALTPNPHAVIRNPYNSAADISAGKLLFQSHCGICHGADGFGTLLGPSLVQRQMIRGSSDWAIYRTISLGIAGTAMPSTSLPEADKWRLVGYVSSLMWGTESSAKLLPPPGIQTLNPVRYEDIRRAYRDQDHWLTYSRTYDGHRFSPSNQITTTNVAHLRLVWMRQYSKSDSRIETSPLVVDNYMFVTVPPNRVEALDVKTGTLIWAYDRHLPEHLSLCCGYVNRGLAVLDKTLFFGTLDAHLVALDMTTGEVRWDVEIADYRSGYSITAAPLVVKNMVITGVAGGEYGIRGFVDARDAVSGREIWKFDSILQPGQSGASTWTGDSWKTGGGPTWMTGSFDPDSNLIYWPTGNASPLYNDEGRNGDNLYTNCVLALDADHGTLQWYFQFMPHDIYDWDATETVVLIDQEIENAPQHLLAQANRNGFYYLLDRHTGRFLLARPYTKVTWAKEIDSHGRPIVNPAAHPTRQGTAISPGTGGGANWESPSYSPLTGLIYVPSIDEAGIYYEENAEYHLGERFDGGYFRPFLNIPRQGVVVALKAMTGELQWEYRNSASSAGEFEWMGIGGLLSTAGGIVFGSQGHYFFALNAITGQELWRIRVGEASGAAPITFLCEGNQLVTIAVGHDLLTFGL
jgi:alcohol dehydrogenase (cytochrome c)